jgi:hypothetical protein
MTINYARYRYIGTAFQRDGESKLGVEVQQRYRRDRVAKAETGDVLSPVKQGNTEVRVGVHISRLRAGVGTEVPAGRYGGVRYFVVAILEVRFGFACVTLHRERFTVPN